MKAMLVGFAAAGILAGCIYGFAAVMLAVGWAEDMDYAWLFASACGLTGGIAAARRYERDGGFNRRSQLLGSWGVSRHRAR